MRSSLPLRRRLPVSHRLGFILLFALSAAACGSDAEVGESTADANTNAASSSTTTTAAVTTTESSESSASSSAGELFPDVVGATAEQDGDGSWTFSATLSSPYDSPERYADAWRVVGPDGEVYGIRELTHDHANEQPFTRSQSGIVVPDDVTTVTVQGRDQVSGWGGATIEVVLER